MYKNNEINYCISYMFKVSAKISIDLLSLSHCFFVLSEIILTGEVVVVVRVSN